jgi:signal transduction histidine kinase
MKPLPLLFHAVILLLAIGITITVVLVSLRRRSAPGATSLIVFALALIVWVVSDFLYSMGVPPIGKFWLSVTYLGATVAPTALLTFSVEYTERGYCLTQRILTLLAIEPVMTQAVFWTYPWHGLFFAGRGIQTVDAVLQKSPWLQINAIYSYSLVLIAVILILQIFSHKLGTYRLQSGAILTGGPIPILVERQRLVRDLHDSVTQKLYGLVTLTEVGQAGLDTGSETKLDVTSAQIISRIGEYARQVLKEMRLLLFELQLVNLERDGLVSILIHRFAAVEGRADAKARLLADKNISLSLEKEVALYFIAQEALNNVLKQASAKSLTIRLKQKKNVILEIEDDGCRISPQVVDQSGMGLRNM